MIQRKQTLWFLLASVIACSAYILPFGFKNTTSIVGYDINVHDFTAQTNMLLKVLFGLITLCNFIAIFLFKKRKIQVMLALVAIFLSLGALGYEIYFSTIGGNNITLGTANGVIYIGLLVPATSLLCTLMAMRGVNQDIKLLKETDRLR